MSVGGGGFLESQKNAVQLVEFTVNVCSSRTDFCLNCDFGGTDMRRFSAL